MWGLNLRMDKWLNIIFNELEVVKLAIVLAERPDILDQVKAALNETSNQ